LEIFYFYDNSQIIINWKFLIPLLKKRLLCHWKQKQVRSNKREKIAALKMNYKYM
jgi:hypothetical protein